MGLQNNSVTLKRQRASSNVPKHSSLSRRADWTKDGHPTEEAEKTLADFEGAVQAVRNTQGIIERTLRAIKAGALP